jgi:hypothetical protein
MKAIYEWLEKSKYRRDEIIPVYSQDGSLKDEIELALVIRNAVWEFVEKAFKWEYENREELQQNYLDGYDEFRGEYYDFVLQRFLVEILKVREV